MTASARRDLRAVSKVCLTWVRANSERLCQFRGRTSSTVTQSFSRTSKDSVPIAIYTNSTSTFNRFVLRLDNGKRPLTNSFLVVPFCRSWPSHLELRPGYRSIYNCLQSKISNRWLELGKWCSPSSGSRAWVTSETCALSQQLAWIELVFVSHGQGVDSLPEDLLVTLKMVAELPETARAAISSSLFGLGGILLLAVALLIWKRMRSKSYNSGGVSNAQVEFEKRTDGVAVHGQKGSSKTHASPVAMEMHPRKWAFPLTPDGRRIVWYWHFSLCWCPGTENSST